MFIATTQLAELFDRNTAISQLKMFTETTCAEHDEHPMCIHVENDQCFVNRYTIIITCARVSAQALKNATSYYKTELTFSKQHLYNMSIKAAILIGALQAVMNCDWILELAKSAGVQHLKHKHPPLWFRLLS